jgi:hypothetical protein
MTERHRPDANDFDIVTHIPLQECAQHLVEKVRDVWLFLIKALISYTSSLFCDVNLILAHRSFCTL